MANEIKLSVVIPAYNEEKRIGGTLEKVIAYLLRQEYKFEIIIVDDGSKDRTTEIAANLTHGLSNYGLVKTGINKGKGSVVKTGMLKARGEFVLFMDADYSTPIEEIEKCFPAFELGFDIVIGSRRLPESKIKVHQPFLREMMGKVFRLIANSLLGLNVTDITCGFKCFKNNVAQGIFKKQLLERWGFDAEILFLARKSGYLIQEIPVCWVNDDNSRVSLKIDALRSFQEIIQIVFNNSIGKYKNG